MAEALRALLSWEQKRELDEWAPTHLTMPTGSRIRVDYLDASAPAVSVRLQEVFGLSASPLLGRGRVAVTFKLLSPAQRPLQVTRDLGELLARLVRAGAQGHARSLPEALLAREPARGAAGARHAPPVKQPGAKKPARRIGYIRPPMPPGKTHP